MDASTEIELIDELRDLDARGEKFLDNSVETSSIDRYMSAERFAEEEAALFLRLPRLVATSAELAKPGDFLRVELSGRSVIVTRDREHVVRAFANVCRHRGARLVAEDSGCKQRFSCPYHAWTYANSGELVAVPHEEAGFPDLDRSTRGLIQYPCVEHAGSIWVSLDRSRPLDIGAWLGGLGSEFEALGFAKLRPFATETLTLDVNWKVLVEGGIEAYHFKVAHRATIASLFLDNLSSYQRFAPHLRSVLPRTTLTEEDADKVKRESLREHANLIYSILPTVQFLVQADHIVRIRLEPLAADKTEIHLSTLVDPDHPAPEHYWARHHEFTLKTLREDFDLGEGIQAGLGQGGDALLFGRYEGALAYFNDQVEALIART